MQFAQYYQNYGPMMDGWQHDNGWVGLIFSMLFLLMIIAIAYYAIRAISGHHPAHTQYREPLDIAKERYAKGEITKEELIEIKKELK